MYLVELKYQDDGAWLRVTRAPVSLEKIKSLYFTMSKDGKAEVRIIDVNDVVIDPLTL